MTSAFLRLRIGAVLVAVFGLACSAEPERVLHHEESPPANPRSEPTAQLPLDHAPVGTMNEAAGDSSGTGGSGLAWQAPDGWIAVTPSSRMRRAQYRVPGPGGDGECAVFYFGPGQGGGAEANISRWASQFIQPDGRDSHELIETTRFEVNGRQVLQGEVTGTYSGGGPMMGGSAEPLPGYMLLGAIVEGPDASWFFKFTGPEQTVREQKEAFGAMLRSIRAGA